MAPLENVTFPFNGKPLASQSPSNVASGIPFIVYFFGVDSDGFSFSALGDGVVDAEGIVGASGEVPCFGIAEEEGLTSADVFGGIESFVGTHGDTTGDFQNVIGSVLELSCIPSCMTADNFPSL